MEALLVLLVVMFLTWVLYKLKMFKPVINLTEVANLESEVYKMEHRGRAAKRLENVTTDVDVDKVNANIDLLNSLNFD